MVEEGRTNRTQSRDRFRHGRASGSRTLDGSRRRRQRHRGRSGVTERADDVRIALAGRPVERRPAGFVARTNVRALVDQQPDDRRIGMGRR